MIMIRQTNNYISIYMEPAVNNERLFEKLKAAGQGHLAEHYH